MKMQVVFVQGGGQGAYEEDRMLAASLQAALGAAYNVRYPQMPNEDSPDYPSWKATVAQELASLDGEVLLVGHSLGGSVLMKYLSEEKIKPSIGGLFLVAAPYWGGDEHWQYDDLTLHEDFAAKLPYIPRIFLYHSHDDAIVPFAHLALYGAKLPQATVRSFESGGHQLNNDLSQLAADVKVGRRDRPGYHDQRL